MGVWLDSVDEEDIALTAVLPSHHLGMGCVMLAMSIFAVMG